ncbi:MAG TPA: tetratricopeptide repeat protein [Thermoanaerobaculia bacterium]|nr:tetratricopeptide repeat protein [Thermoanaerobaculia bacterium]
MRVRMALTSFGALAIATLAIAAQQGRLTGTVTGPEGAPLEGVVITVTTPNINSFKLTVKTDKKGHYGMLLNDATIPYRFHFELEGYAPYEEMKKLSIGDANTIDVKLQKPVTVETTPTMGGQAALAYNKGIELLNSGDRAGAEAKFQEAVAKNPDLPQGWQALTVVAYQNKDWKKVLEAGQKATDLDPTLSSVYQMMAVAAQQTGDKKGAAQWNARYAEANPDTPEVIYNKGVDALNQRKMQEAADYFAKAVEAKPDFALAHFQLGLVDFSLKKNDAAKEHLQKYLELDPQGSEAETAKELLAALK